MGLFTVREKCVLFSKMGMLFIALIIMLSRPVPATCKVLEERRTTDVMLISAEFQDVIFGTNNKR
jgi:hypothetical protein